MVRSGQRKYTLVRVAAKMWSHAKEKDREKWLAKGREGQKDRRSKQRESGERTGREGGERETAEAAERATGLTRAGRGAENGNESATAHCNYNVQELGQSSIHHSSSQTAKQSGCWLRSLYIWSHGKVVFFCFVFCSIFLAFIVQY